MANGIIQHNICDLSFLSKLDAVKRLSIDSIRTVSNLEAIERLNLEKLKLEIFEQKDYSVIKNLPSELKSLSITNGVTNKVNFDCGWLLKYKNYLNFI